jgi:hypothetical protein
LLKSRQSLQIQGGKTMLTRNNQIQQNEVFERLIRCASCPAISVNS